LAQPRHSGSYLNYYDKHFFSKIFVFSSNSIQIVNNFIMSNIVHLDIDNKLISKLPVNKYILDDNFTLSINSEKKYAFLTNVVGDDVQIQIQMICIYIVFI